MSSRESMMSYVSKIAAGVALVLMAAATGTWLSAKYVSYHHRPIVWEQQLKFRDGFVRTESFTVPSTGTYYLAIAYKKHTPEDSLQTMNSAPFLVDYEIRSDRISIVRGFGGDQSKLAVHQPDRTMNVLTSFNAMSGNVYDLNLRVINADPSLAAITPSANILASLETTQRGEFLRWMFDAYSQKFASLAFVAGVPAIWLFWRAKRREKLKLGAA